MNISQRVDKLEKSLETQSAKRTKGWLDFPDSHLTLRGIALVGRNLLTEEGQRIADEVGATCRLGGECNLPQEDIKQRLKELREPWIKSCCCDDEITPYLRNPATLENDLRKAEEAADI